PQQPRLPMPPNSPFHTPNGVSLRPAGEKMVSNLSKFREDVMIYRMQEATEVPEGMCVFHEHSDHYSLQVAREMTLEELNERGYRAQTKEEFLDAYYDEDDQDN
ncbi:hypothetical protein BC829DRAFT_396150, partial [Chytridium lagenaria]